MRSLITSVPLLTIVISLAATRVHSQLGSRWCNAKATVQCNCPRFVSNNFLNAGFSTSVAAVDSIIKYGKDPSNALVYVRKVNYTEGIGNVLKVTCYRLKAEITQPANATKTGEVVSYGLPGNTVQLSFEYVKPCEQFGNESTSNSANMSYNLLHGQDSNGRLNKLSASRLWANQTPKTQFLTLNVVGAKNEEGIGNYIVAVGRVVPNANELVDNCDFEAYIGISSANYTNTVVTYLKNTDAFKGTLVDEDGQFISDLGKTVDQCLDQVAKCTDSA